MGTIVAIVFLISFFINVSREATLILQGACVVSFAMAVLGGSTAIFGRLFTRPLGGYLAVRRMLRRLRNQPEGYVSKRGGKTESGG